MYKLKIMLKLLILQSVIKNELIAFAGWHSHLTDDVILWIFIILIFLNIYISKYSLHFGSLGFIVHFGGKWHCERLENYLVNSVEWINYVILS